MNPPVTNVPECDRVTYKQAGAGMTQGGKGLLVRVSMSVVLVLVALLWASPASARRQAVVVAGGGLCSIGSVSSGVFVDRDAAVAPFLPAPDGNRVEGNATYVGLVRNETSQPIAVTRVDACFFDKGGALLGQMTMRDSFVSTIAVDAVIPAGSYSPFSRLLLFDGGGYLNSVADVMSTRTAVTYEIADRAPRFAKVTVSTKGSSSEVQVVRVTARNSSKRARYEMVVGIFFDSAGRVADLGYKYVRVPAKGKKTLVFKHAGYPTQANAASVRGYARIG